jgi:hypothetical protein
MTLAIVLPHVPVQREGQGRQKGSAANAYLAGHTGSISEIENLTGVHLLPKFDGDSLKRAVASELWPRN